MISRRGFLQTTTALAGLAATSMAVPAVSRRYHVCLGPKIAAARPELLETVRNAGVTDVWQAAYFYGHWHATPEELKVARAQVEAAGLRWHIINVPLGHPGDSLGDSTGQTALTPPGHWRMATRPDGSHYSGTSLHPPATEENVKAVKALAALEPDCIFLDDDFRLATGPGVIGGCFCDAHRDEFLETHGYAPSQWDALLSDVAARRLSPTLRAWVDFHCDALTACFRAQQAAAPDVAIGNMIMYLGAEKAGIRLPDYADVPFRVGELMFNDPSFGPVKGKTDELFSALFHRRFATAELAYSESTAFPADQLSAKNMAAKLNVTTIADVRNTMYMSGMTPFPESHWGILAPAMEKQSEIHRHIAGHRPAGPMKHVWGEAARYVGDDQPFSLFLASGIPFEVCEAMPGEGHAFLGNQDAAHAPFAGKETGAKRYGRPGVAACDGVQPMEESLAAIWALKRAMISQGLDVPYVVDEKPVVCAWYPTARMVLLWNLAEEQETFRLCWEGKEREVAVAGLDLDMVRL